MVDPVSSKAIANVAKPDGAKLDKAAEAGKGKQADGPSFKDVMKNQEAQGPDEAKQVQGADAIEKANKADKPMKARVDKFVKGVLHDEHKLDHLMSRAMHGADMSNTELLKLQGLMYSYSQKVDLASKVVE